MPDIHDQKNPPQRLAAAQIAFDHGAPGFMHSFGDLGVAIAGQVHQPSLVIQTKEIEQLGPARRLADSGQVFLVGDRVDGAGLSRVGTAGKGHLQPLIGRRIIKPGSARQITGFLIERIQVGIYNVLLTFLVYPYFMTGYPRVARHGPLAGPLITGTRDDNLGAGPGFEALTGLFRSAERGIDRPGERPRIFQ